MDVGRSRENFRERTSALQRAVPQHSVRFRESIVAGIISAEVPPVNESRRKSLSNNLKFLVKKNVYNTNKDAMI